MAQFLFLIFVLYYSVYQYSAQDFYTYSPCPEGFEYIADRKRCYNLVTEKSNWQDMRGKCNGLSLTAHLVSIKNQRDQDDIEFFLNSKNDVINEKCVNLYPRYTKVWTSGQWQDPNNCRTEFVWKPFANTEIPLSYSNWKAGEPNNSYKLENCIHLWQTGYNQWKWNDVACSTSNNQEMNWAFFDNGNLAMCGLCEVEVP